MKPISYLSALFLAFCGMCAAQSLAEQQDARVIENLVAAGSDISKLHNVDFFMLLPSEAQAKMAAAEMERLGYTVASIDQPPGQSQWQIQATRRMAPQLEAMTATTRELEAVAARHGGDYDGWGTGVVD